MARKRNASRREDVPAEVQKAIQQLREAHEVGREILELCGRRSEYGRNSIAEAAEHLGMSTETARKRRQFAALYSEHELENLCQLCAKHRVALGISIVYKFLSVPRDGKQRTQFQRKAIEQGWSRARVVAELSKKYGKRRRRAGRTPTIPDEPAGQLVQLLERVERWLRWTSTALVKAEGAGHATEFPDLPVEVQKRLKAVDRAMKRLRREVDREVGEPAA